MMALSSLLLLHQHDQEREHFRENRNACEQEERKVDGTRDLRGRARLAGNAFSCRSGQLADAEARADDDHAQTEGCAEERDGVGGSARTGGGLLSVDSWAE